MLSTFLNNKPPRRKWPEAMTEYSSETTYFINELDAAIEAHMGWVRRILRYAVLGTSPSDDVLAQSAHSLCHFGRWFALNKPNFEKLDAQKAQRVDAVHQEMHDAVRAICTELLAGRGGESTDLDVFEQTQSELIQLLAEFKTEFLANTARYDPLTGLLLRYGLEIEFLQVQKSCKRNNNQIYIVIIDVDHFKRVNDNYGHSVGDMALRHLANTLRCVVRANEPLFRFGGEEFLLLMQCQSSESATVAAHRIVQAVRSAPVPIPQGDSLQLTVTLGLARVENDEDMASALQRADKALHTGKNAGRNCYVIAKD